MIRLHIIAEGQTEEGFVKQVLGPYLARRNVFADVRLVMTKREQKTGACFRGGLVSYQRARRDIVSWIKQDQSNDCRFTTMFDFYALPGDFPGMREASNITDIYKRIEYLEDKLKQDIGEWKFIPYIQLHEFETLLFAKPESFLVEYPECTSAVNDLKTVLNEFGDNPELIDDGQQSAPSKRIITMIPHYRKASSGPIIAREVGIDTMRHKCRHYNDWLSLLEG